MRILGIDPGIALVGWGVVEYSGTKFRPIAYGSISTPKDLPTHKRLEIIYSDLCQIIDRYRPEQAAIEELFFNTNITTGIRVSEARGVILLACSHKGLELQEYTPLQVKQAVVGYGRAEKKQKPKVETPWVSFYSKSASRACPVSRRPVGVVPRCLLYARVKEE